MPDTHEQFIAYLQEVRKSLVLKKNSLEQEGITCNELENSIYHIDTILTNLPNALKIAYREVLGRRQNASRQSIR